MLVKFENDNGTWKCKLKPEWRWKNMWFLIEIWGVFFASMNLTKLFYDENIMKSCHVAYFWKLQHIIKNMGKIVSLS